MGTFDGNHKTISGLKVTKRGDCRAALFGTVSGTVVFRNLTISEAEVRCPDFNGDFYGSALIGTAYGVVTIENVDVVDSYISGNNKVGALIAHDGVMNTLTVSGCDVSGTTFEALNAADGGSVGGLLGYFQTGGEHHITNCSVKGCTFNVVNSRNNGARANGLLIGGINSKANQKLYINGAEIDGITWNEKFYVDGVEVTEGKFVSPYGGLIGGERDDHAEGELYLENELVVPTNYVYTAEQLAEVVNGATEDITVAFANDLEGTVLLKQKQGVNVTILGNDKNYNGVLSLRGYMEYGTSKLTIKNVHFNAGATADACILGEDKGVTGVYAYSHCVTIDHCTFSGNSGCAAVRHEDGGDSNYTFKNCEVDNTMHSMIQSNNILGNLIVEDCKVYSKNGANLNSTCNATFTGCEFDVKGYAVRVGVNSGGNPYATKVYTFTNCTLKSQCEDGDAVIIVRKDAQKATLTFVDCEVEGSTIISGITSDTKVTGIPLPQQANEIWYVGDVKLEPTTPTALNANIVSNVWDSTTGKGVITFDAPLTTIGNEAFKRITNTTPSNWVTSISLPEGLKTIGNYAFYQCFNLTEIVVPDSVTSIGQYAFGSCQAATTVTLGSGVTSIASGAFYGCWELKEVVSKPTTPPAIADKWVFYDCDIRNVIVPAASVDAYKAANFWSSLNIVAE